MDVVADYIGLALADTQRLARIAPRTYRRYNIPKKTGGHRVIHHPSKQTKSLQYALMSTLLSSLPIHDSAAAYVRDRESPLLKNASAHAAFAYSVRVDMRDFFPSIRPDDLFAAIVSSGVLGDEGLSDEEMSFLRNALFVHVPLLEMGLAIGAPSSPMVSNIVMFKVDERLRSYAQSVSAVYTRYADDLVFSSDKAGACGQFVKEVASTLQAVAHSKLEINDSKTVFSSRTTRRVITGLIVCPDGVVSVGRRNKRRISALMCHFRDGTLDPKSLAYLQGYLAFVLDVEPGFYNRLCMKYGSALVKNALDSRKTAT